jgi:hypothetical protein
VTRFWFRGGRPRFAAGLTATNRRADQSALRHSTVPRPAARLLPSENQVTEAEDGAIDGYVAPQLVVQHRPHL